MKARLSQVPSVCFLLLQLALILQSLSQYTAHTRKRQVEISQTLLQQCCLRAMMLEYSFGMTEEANLIREAVNASMEAEIVTEDIAQKGAKSYGTNHVGKWLVNYINQY